MIPLGAGNARRMASRDPSPTPNVHTCVNSRVSSSSIANPTGASLPLAQGVGLITLLGMTYEMCVFLDDTAEFNNQISVHSGESATNKHSKKEQE